MLADERDGPILDLGCGTGRLLVPLLRDQRTVVGVDLSAAMLARARARLRRLGAQRARHALLLQADLRHLPLRGPFRLAVAAFHTVQHLVDDRELVQVFRGVRRVLAPDGWFAFDVFVPPPAWLARPPGRRYGRTVFRHPITRQKLAYSLSHRLDVARQALHLRIHYQPLDDGGAPAGVETSVRLCHRQLSPTSVRALLRRAGLDVVATWGGFDGEPLDADGAAPTEQHVYLARPRAR